MADSALDYTAEITALSLSPNRLQVKYSPADSADTARQPLYRNLGIRDDQYNDSDIQVLIKAGAKTVANQWQTAITTQQENPTFNDSDFLGDTYNFRYKPSFRDVPPAYNLLSSKLVPYDSEGADEVRTKYNVVALEDSEKTTIYREIFVAKDNLEIALRKEGRLDSVQLTFGVADPVNASWDASAGAAFDFSTDKISSFGVKTIERVSAGTYRIIPLVPFTSANYTISTSVGAEDYDGAGASPRQLAVISRATDSFQVHCERTDDAVDEDNSYMSIIVAPIGTNDSDEIEYRHRHEFNFNDDVMNTVQTLLGYDDSDWANLLFTA